MSRLFARLLQHVVSEAGDFFRGSVSYDRLLLLDSVRYLVYMEPVKIMGRIKHFDLFVAYRSKRGDKAYSKCFDILQSCCKVLRSHFGRLGSQTQEHCVEPEDLFLSDCAQRRTILTSVVLTGLSNFFSTSAAVSGRIQQTEVLSKIKQSRGDPNMMTLFCYYFGKEQGTMRELFTIMLKAPTP